MRIKELKLIVISIYGLPTIGHSYLMLIQYLLSYYLMKLFAIKMVI